MLALTRLTAANPKWLLVDVYIDIASSKVGSSRKESSRMLFVRKTHRGKQIGKTLMEQVFKDFPNQPIYVMSDVDPYYEKLGYRREGSIFGVKV